MTNTTTNSSVMRDACNSSYTDGAVTASTYCAFIGSSSVYNHSHSAHSKHALIPFTIGADGKIGGVYITPEIRILVRGSASVPVTVNYI